MTLDLMELACEFATDLPLFEIAHPDGRVERFYLNGTATVSGMAMPAGTRIFNRAPALVQFLQAHLEAASCTQTHPFRGSENSSADRGEGAMGRYLAQFGDA